MCLHTDVDYFKEESKNHGTPGCYVMCEDCGNRYWANSKRIDKYDKEGWSCEYCGGFLNIDNDEQ